MSGVGDRSADFVVDQPFDRLVDLARHPRLDLCDLSLDRGVLRALIRPPILGVAAVKFSHPDAQIVLLSQCPGILMSMMNRVSVELWNLHW